MSKPVNQHEPPRWALKLFKWVCYPEYHADIEGDLWEIFEESVKARGYRMARLLIWLDVIMLLRPSIIKSFLPSSSQLSFIMLRHYFLISLRHLWKNKFMSSVNIIGLALGMFVFMMIGLWVYDEHNYNRYHPNIDKIAQVYLHRTYNDITGTNNFMAVPLAEILRTDYQSYFQSVSLTSHIAPSLLTAGEKRLRREGMHVEPNFLDIFDLDFLAGSKKHAFKQPHSIILSQSFAHVLFGEEDPVGSIVKYDAEIDLIVTGVYKDFPANSSFHNASFFSTWEYLKEQRGMGLKSLKTWGDHSFKIFVKLQENVDVEIASNQISDIEKEYNNVGDPELFLFPMSKWHLYEEFRNGKNVGGRIQYVQMFTVIGLFVLFLAWINFVNLNTARSESRAKEVGVRKAIGSLRSQLMAQFVSESFLISGLSIIVALVLVWASLDAFNHIANKEISIDWLNPVWAFILVGFTIISGLLAGIYPALYLSSFRPIQMLNRSFHHRNKAVYFRRTLVVFQFTITIALLIGTIVVYQQIEFAKHRPVGYEREKIIQVYTSSEIQGNFELFKNELLKRGNISSVSTASSSIIDIWSNQSGFEWEGKDPNSLESFGVIEVSHDYGSTIKWNILEGRDYHSPYSTDSTSVIINESAAELIGLSGIVGKNIQKWGKDYRIIGIVENMVIESPWQLIRPTLFFPYQGKDYVYFVRFKENVPIDNALQDVKKVYEELSPSVPFDYEFVDAEYAAKFEAEERIGKLSKFFVAFAILISCLGLFGLASFMTERRAKEVAIRKVLGASITHLWRLLSQEHVLLILISYLIACPISWYFLTQWLEGYNYRIQIEWWIFLLAGVLAFMIALLTVSYQSLKAAFHHPVEALKDE